MNIPSALGKLLTPGIPLYVLSPHIDDGIWSVGGLLYGLAEEGVEITLISIFTHTIYVYDEARPPAEATAIRKGEDYNAARVAGLKGVLSLDFPDGILRDTPQTKVLNPSYETPPYLLQLVTDCLQKQIPKHAVVMAPAGFGGHMDHLTVRRAARQLPHSTIFYQDLPYGARQGNSEELEKFLSESLMPVQLNLQAKQINKHLELFWLYRSQTSQSVADEIRDHLQRIGLNLWIRQG